MKVHVPPALMRRGAQQVGRRVLNPRLPWEVQRRRLDRLVASWPLPRGTSVAATACNGIPAEVITTGRAHSPAGSVGAGESNAVTVVHFHGGGYCVGSPAEARDWAAHLSAQAGCCVVLPDYRLAPEHPYPAAVDDARAVVAAVLGRADSGTVLVSGDSAGGGLALATAVAMAGAKDDARLAGCMLLSPWLDLTADRAALPELVRRDVLLSPSWLEACAQAYAPVADRTQPMVSPLHANLDGLPPLLIQCGTDELLAPDAEKLAALAAAAGLDVTYSQWPGMWHDFVLQPDLVAAAARALAEAASFVTRIAATNSRRSLRGRLTRRQPERAALGLNSFQWPSEITSTVSPVTAMAV